MVIMVGIDARHHVGVRTRRGVLSAHAYRLARGRDGVDLPCQRERTRSGARRAVQYFIRGRVLLRTVLRGNDHVRGYDVAERVGGVRELAEKPVGEGKIGSKDRADDEEKMGRLMRSDGGRDCRVLFRLEIFRYEQPAREYVIGRDELFRLYADRVPFPLLRLGVRGERSRIDRALVVRLFFLPFLSADGRLFRRVPVQRRVRVLQLAENAEKTNGKFYEIMRTNV